MIDWSGWLIVELALGVTVGIVLAWWAIRTLERWSYLVHATPCWPTTLDQVERLESWEKFEALDDLLRYPTPVRWIRGRLRRKWRRHCELLRSLGWSDEEILGRPDRQPRRPKDKRGPEGRGMK
jgi:hypothetical protein